MPDGELVSITVLQVGHPLVPIVALQAAEVGPGHQRRVASHFQLGLERKRLVTDNIGGRRAAIDQEYGNRSHSLRKPAVLAVAGNRADRQDDTEAVALGHIGLDRLLGLLGQVERDAVPPERFASSGLALLWPGSVCKR